MDSEQILWILSIFLFDHILSILPVLIRANILKICSKSVLRLLSHKRKTNLYVKCYIIYYTYTFLTFRYRDRSLLHVAWVKHRKLSLTHMHSTPFITKGSTKLPRLTPARWRSNNSTVMVSYMKSWHSYSPTRYKLRLSRKPS